MRPHFFAIILLCLLESGLCRTIDTPDEVLDHLKKLEDAKTTTTRKSSRGVQYDLVIAHLRLYQYPDTRDTSIEIPGKLKLEFSTEGANTLDFISSEQLNSHRQGLGPIRVILPDDSTLLSVKATYIPPDNEISTGGLSFDKFIMLKTKDRAANGNSHARCTYKYKHLIATVTYPKKFGPCVV
ncbi:hypothetical protein HDE_07635 [Halotydeus destructor]|nr:hypothetical protein HDE_07635 [Halotydeus destructor]